MSMSVICFRRRFQNKSRGKGQRLRLDIAQKTPANLTKTASRSGYLTSLQSIKHQTRRSSITCTTSSPQTSTFQLMTTGWWRSKCAICESLRATTWARVIRRFKAESSPTPQLTSALLSILNSSNSRTTSRSIDKSSIVHTNLLTSPLRMLWTTRRSQNVHGIEEEAQR